MGIPATGVPIQGKTVRIAYETLSKELKSEGWEVKLKEKLLTEQEILESNIILLNGIPIEDLLPNIRKSESCCASCGELLGAPTMCRAVEKDGQTFEAIPAAMIVDAVYRLIQT